MAWGFAIVEGLSMVPAFAPGDRLLVRYGARFDVGSVVLVDRGERLDLKRVSRIEGNHVFVAGDNAAVSTDSRHYGAVPPEAVVAVAVRRLPRWLPFTGG